ncbi:PREDICTED: microtubule-associated protein SPIRAL2-like [Ipomoea nil]|uniref:microtubule-associated protein SPIRAL2-like n=1 Tax=Ipomoea nil TaxID=35883 RepID=UPI0009010871|nr:PREDICTED: microtubule-associated protein SPIRAL2-like [Ipomoea nil]
MALSRQLSVDFKNRVITCLNRLSDRDTLAAATTELEAIARGLPNDGFAPFLTCLSATDSSDKSPVRRHSVRLIGVLSAAHGDALSPHLSKMLSAVLRRLRDPDSAVRAACVEAVSSIAAQITKPPFSSIVKPFVDSIFHEQDHNSQIGASLCLAAAIEATPDPDPAELRKLLPKLYKLVKNDCFKAKPSLLSLIGSIVSVGGAANRTVLNGLVSTLVEFLSSEDWAARKAAAETLGRLAVAERDLLAEFKPSCIASLDTRRFDKVKAVRETMNRALDWWKEVPATSDEVSPQLQAKSSPKDYCSGASSPTPSKSPSDAGSETPQPKRSFSRSKSLASTSSYSSTITTQKNSPTKKFVRAKSNGRSSESSVTKSSKVDTRRSSELKTEVPEKQTSSLELACDDNESRDLNVSDSTESKSCKDMGSGEKQFKFGNSRFGARIVPVYETETCSLSVRDANAVKDAIESKEEYEDMFLIYKQLRQIESQQSSLMDLLERFIGSSQNGMNSLEERVNGLERVLDEMQQCLGFSGRRIPTTDYTGSTCFMLPRAEFLSPKFWRKQEGQSYNTSFSLSSRSQPENTMHMMPGEDDIAQTLIENSSRNRHPSMHGTGETLESSSTRKWESARGCLAGRLNGAALANCIKQET